MTRRLVPHVLRVALVLAGITACGSPTPGGGKAGGNLSEPASPTKSSIESFVRATPRPENATPQDSTYQREAVVRLHEQKLITIPAIQEKTTETVTLYRGGSISREEASRRLNNWLDEYIKKHPDEIQALEARFKASGAKP